MKKINNIFYSLQGEGRNTGRAAVFIRFAGCNLHCPFCDTEFVSYREMSDDEILAEISKYEVRKRREERGERREDSSRYEVRGKATGRRTQFGNARYEDSSADEPDFVLRKPLIVLTGGEPTLQVDEAFVDLLHQHGYEVAMESNGTLPAPKNLDWLTVSPKFRGTRYEVRGTRIPDELKIVFDEDTPAKLSSYLAFPNCVRLPVAFPRTSHLEASSYLYLQPCDTGDPIRNKRIVALCVDYIKSHPEWRLSLQTHKLIDIE